jgi:hypothetical protein
MDPCARWQPTFKTPLISTRPSHTPFLTPEMLTHHTFCTDVALVPTAAKTGMQIYTE